MGGTGPVVGEEAGEPLKLVGLARHQNAKKTRLGVN